MFDNFDRNDKYNKNDKDDKNDKNDKNYRNNKNDRYDNRIGHRETYEIYEDLVYKKTIKNGFDMLRTLYNEHKTMALKKESNDATIETFCKNSKIYKLLKK